MVKLAHISESVIHVGIVVLNLNKWLAELLLRLFPALLAMLRTIVKLDTYRNGLNVTHQYLFTLTARQHDALQTELANYQLRLFQEALLEQ